VVVASDPFINPVAGQLAFLTIALFNTAVPVMKMFRWRKTVDGKDSFYVDWTSAMGTTYWEYSNMVLDYGRMAIYGVAFLT
jgi:hypothetical protein